MSYNQLMMELTQLYQNVEMIQEAILAAGTPTTPEGLASLNQAKADLVAKNDRITFISQQIQANPQWIADFQEKAGRYYRISVRTNAGEFFYEYPKTDTWASIGADLAKLLGYPAQFSPWMSQNGAEFFLNVGGEGLLYEADLDEAYVAFSNFMKANPTYTGESERISELKSQSYDWESLMNVMLEGIRIIVDEQKRANVDLWNKQDKARVDEQLAEDQRTQALIAAEKASALSLGEYLVQALASGGPAGGSRSWEDFFKRVAPRALAFGAPMGTVAGALTGDQWAGFQAYITSIQAKNVLSPLMYQKDGKSFASWARPIYNIRNYNYTPVRKKTYKRKTNRPYKVRG